MSYKRRFLILALVFFVLCDAIAWFATYQVTLIPSPEKLRAQQAQATAEANREPPIAQAAGVFDQRLSLDGDWLYRQTGSEMAGYSALELDVSGWKTMQIPQNWYMAGLNYQGVIWFRKEFTVDASWQGRLVRVAFSGVDYFADVWLNGKRLGRHEGYFEPFAYPVSDALRYGQKNVLVVRVDSPYQEFDSVWPGRKTLIKGVFEHSPFHPGSAWRANGQEYNTGGIWNDVYLEASNYLTIDQALLQAAWEKGIAQGNNPTFTAKVTVTNHSDQPASASLEVTLAPRNFQGQTIALATFAAPALQPGVNEVTVAGTIATPALWQPWDRGAPNLYNVQVRVVVSGQPAAERSAVFGFREVKVDPATWQWTVNGQRYFPRGTNYLSSMWLAQSTSALLAKDVSLMRYANLNFIRLPAHVEPEAFYQSADEAGLLVWQDFPLQWGYSDAPAFLEETQREMRAMVQLLYNHPSIVVWCAHNESPWATDAIRSKAPNADSRQNKQMDADLQQIAKELDPTRYAHLNSGTSDNHEYAGWTDGSWKDYANLPGAPMVTAFGAGSLPNLPMMQKMFLPEQLAYQSGETDERWEFQGFSSITQLDNTGIDYTRPKEGEDPLPALQGLVSASQDYQANLLKFAAESYRRSKYIKVQGIFQDLFVDPWPSIGLSVLDNDRQPKRSFAALQTAMQPVLPTINASLPTGLDGEYWTYQKIDRVGMGLYVVNDTLQAYPQASLGYVLQKEDGTVLDQKIAPVTLPADSSSIYQVIRNLALEPGKYQVVMEVRDAQGKLLGQNTFKFEALAAVQPTPTPTTNP